MVTNTNYHLQPGYKITVSVADGNAHVQQLESASVAAYVNTGTAAHPVWVALAEAS